MKSIRWDSICKPRVMTIEHNGSLADLNALRDLLIGAGYQEHFAEHEWFRGGDIWVSYSS